MRACDSGVIRFSRPISSSCPYGLVPTTLRGAVPASIGVPPYCACGSCGSPALRLQAQGGFAVTPGAQGPEIRVRQRPEKIGAAVREPVGFEPAWHVDEVLLARQCKVEVGE